MARLRGQINLIYKQTVNKKTMKNENVTESQLCNQKSL